jgi:transposase
MSRPVRAKPFVTQMRRGRLPARSCGHDRTAVDRPDRPSGRNAFPSGITPSTIMSPTRSRHGSWTEIRLGARAHTTRTDNRPHGPPSHSKPSRRSRAGSTCHQVPAQIRSVASLRLRCVHRASVRTLNEGTVVMIVIEADTHKRSHTVAAIHEATGRVLVDRTVPAKQRAFEDLLLWARGLDDPQRAWAIEDCRHVSGALERFLLAHGERVVRVPPKLMAGARDSARERGKSDVIDAVAIARAAIREGLENLPVAQLAGPELDVRLLVDLCPDVEASIPSRHLDRPRTLQRVARRLRALERSARVRVAVELVRRVSELTRRVDELERELAALVRIHRPVLLAETGCGPMTAAILIGHTAGAGRFPSDGHSARLAGVAPIPVSSGRRHRHRLHRGGDRQLNKALHIIAITRARLDPETRDYLQRKHAEGKTTAEALRCLKRHLARRFHRLLALPPNGGRRRDRIAGPAPTPMPCLT